MWEERHKRLTVGVLAGWQVYEGALHSYFDPILHGIRSAARDRQCNLMLACGIGHVTGEGQSPPIRPAWPVSAPDADFVPVGPWNTDGLLVITPLLSDDRSRYVRQVIADGHAVAFIGLGEGGPAVVLDNEDGIRQAVEHLVAHGHRRIAFIAGYEGEKEGDSTRRLGAYRALVRELGLEADDRLVAYGSHETHASYIAMQQILAAKVPFTAVLGSNDESASGAMQAIREAGLRIPHDVAVIGFDDRLESTIQRPSLTSVHSPAFEMGYRALELLQRCIAGEAERGTVVRVPVRLVLRDSCGCPPRVLRTAPPGPAAPQAVRIDPDDADSPRPDRGDKRGLVDAMARAVLAETHYLEPGEVHALCWRLVEAFILSIDPENALEFRHALEKTLDRVAAMQENPHVWQTAISVMRAQLSSLFKKDTLTTARQQMEDILHQARVLISEGTYLYHIRYVIEIGNVDDQIGRMVGQLLTAPDEAGVLEILRQVPPIAGVGRVDVAFFEPKEGDPFAWSVLPGPGEGGRALRFPSRQFPPQALCPRDAPFSLALLPLRIQGELAGFASFDVAGLGACVTVVQQLTSALNSIRLYQEAIEGRRLAEEASRLKTRFLSTVSHELRTPLNSIVGLSEVLLEGVARQEISMPGSYRRDLDRVRVSAQHLDSLIQDVLDLARSEVGQLKLVCEPLDLTEVLEPVLAVGEQMARDKRLRWETNIPAKLPRVRGDRTRLRQVALNLVANAVKFTARGRVGIEVATIEDVVAVIVRDTGLGIPHDEWEVIFDEFRQSERTTARGYGGLGLGLAICKRLVELHGGGIGVWSSGEEGAGSTFYFTLPLLEEPVTGPDRAETPLTHGQTVLLLAKTQGSAGHLREHLAGQGFEVDVLGINEVDDWLSRLLVARPGAVVMDVGLALEQGWEVLKILKGNPATQDTLVLFYALEQERDSGTMLQVDYLTKPIGTTELSWALAQHGLEDARRKHKTILVVDDEPGILEMHARIVQTQLPGCQVLRAADGREALDIIRQARPGLVLLDLMMPELDGFGVLEAMREGELARDIPVIVLTGQTLTEEDMARLNRGVATVLGKGLFSLEETLVHIEKALARQHRLGRDARQIARGAMGYIHEHYAEDISPEDVAKHVSTSKGYLFRCFRREMNISPMAYLSRYRIRQAREMLKDEERSVSEVALAVGFSDSNYFSRVFRRETGMSPTEYRRSFRSLG